MVTKAVMVDDCLRSVILENKNIDIARLRQNPALEKYKSMMISGSMRLDHWKMMHQDCDKKLIVNEIFLSSLGGYEEYHKYLLDLEESKQDNFVDAEQAKIYHKSSHNPVLSINSPDERIGTKARALNYLMSDGVIHGFTGPSLREYLQKNHGLVILDMDDADELARQANKLMISKISNENPVVKSCRETLQKISIEEKWDFEQSAIIADELARQTAKASNDLGKIMAELKVKPDDVKVKKRAIKFIKNLIPDLFELLYAPNQELARLGKKKN